MQEERRVNQEFYVDELLQMFNDFDYDVSIEQDSWDANLGCYKVDG